HSEDQIHITIWRNRKPPERKMSHCSVPFTPVDFHYIRNRTCFFVQVASAASALKDVSYKIYDDENQKICIFVNHFTAPYSVKNKLKPGQMEMLKLTMNKWYNVSQQALDLQNLRFDPDLMGRDIDIILNQRNCMTATLKIIERNFPELLSLNLCNNKLYHLDGLSDIIEKVSKVKTLNLSKNKLESAWELGKVKRLKLKELWLEGNPLCSTFLDQSTHVSPTGACFPFLPWSPGPDGRELSAPMIVDIDSSEIMKPCKESYTGSETLKSIGLLGAYHDETTHSCSSFSPRSNLCKYFKDSRNIKILKDPYLQRKLLKHTKCPRNVDSLSALPETQRDFSSILVDAWCQTVNTLPSGSLGWGKTLPW
uniref:Uncharacterized protein n=1 Tax=Gorilla gorilla gorilla TaxID=9595 RepID=A0A2I2YFF3_GORGO